MVDLDVCECCIELDVDVALPWRKLEGGHGVRLVERGRLGLGRLEKNKECTSTSRLAAVKRQQLESSGPRIMEHVGG
jgi:hypothetical protein